MLFMIVYACIYAIYIACLFVLFEVVWVACALVAMGVLGFTGTPGIVVALALYIAIAVLYTFTAGEVMHRACDAIADAACHGLVALKEATNSAIDSVVGWFKSEKAPVLSIVK